MRATSRALASAIGAGVLWAACGFLAACSERGVGDGIDSGSAGGTDAGGSDGSEASDASEGDASRGDGHLQGFLFHGARGDAGEIVLGSSYRMLFATSAALPDVHIGSPCTTGDDCGGLGAGAGCFRSNGTGFCTIDCPAEDATCPLGHTCIRALYVDENGNDTGLCLPSCVTSADCAVAGAGALSACSGPFATFELGFPFGARACFPACGADPDCNSESSGLLCNALTHGCANPGYYLGSNCASDEDCRNLGPGGTCLENVRHPANRYCTVACVPGDAECVSGYASAADGSDVPVRLKSCNREDVCQVESANTCNYFPDYGEAFCSVKCAGDEDCPRGQCKLETGDCQEVEFWSVACASDSNCAGGLCVSDFHRPGANCSSLCGGDADCSADAVCVTSPVAIEAGDHLSGGFCAPRCTPGPDACAQDPSTRCLMPAAVPEIDFAGSGAASADFCWR